MEEINSIITRKDAKDNNLKFYFTGTPCKYGHIEKRRTSNGSCLGCESEQKYKDRKNNNAKKHYYENVEHRKLCIKIWNKNNKIKVSKYKNNWRNKNTDYFKQYYVDNKAILNKKSSEYKASNKDIVNAYCAFRRANKKNATPKWLSKEQLNEIKSIYSACQKITDDTGILHNVDHIIPLVSDTVCGLHVPWNLQIITAKENISKSNKYEDS